MWDGNAKEGPPICNHLGETGEGKPEKGPLRITPLLVVGPLTWLFLLSLSIVKQATLVRPYQNTTLGFNRLFDADEDIRDPPDRPGDTGTTLTNFNTSA
jgi:hypothetical protein